MQDEYEPPATRFLDEVVAECLKGGMELPFHVVVLGVNGSLLVVRYVVDRNSFERAILADHMEGETFALPINVMVVDARGVAQLKRVFKAFSAPGPGYVEARLLH
jgi:hypothetical protein